MLFTQEKNDGSVEMDLCNWKYFFIHYVWSIEGRYVEALSSFHNIPSQYEFMTPLIVNDK